LSKYAVYAGLAVGAYYLYRRFKKWVIQIFQNKQLSQKIIW
jgi:hypothetical protein